MNIEQELKLALDEREYNLLAGLAGATPSRQVNYYFGCNVLPPSVMVRVRRTDKGCILCCKRRLTSDRGVNVCDERECEISQSLAADMLSRGVRASELDGLLHADISQDLPFSGSMTTYRVKFRWQQWTLELDRNEYLGTTDYELECEDGDVAQLRQLSRALSFSFGIDGRPSEPKVARFCRRLSAK